MIFRKGDLVIDALGALRRVEAIRGNDCILDNGTEDPICEMQLVTVSMGFALAGFPVPFSDGYLIQAVRLGLGSGVCWGWLSWCKGKRLTFSGDKWVNTICEADSPDLARLPILDARDVLPAIVRERLEALVGQEVAR